MTLLSPLALLWLGAIPLLVLLWRLSASHRRVVIPSLIPFEHLVKRQARRKTRLVVNLLFWLQLAALIALPLTLAQPVLLREGARTLLVALDTSASMGAKTAEHDATAFEQAQQALIRRLEHPPVPEQVLVVTTSPVAAVMPAPTGDLATLTQRIRQLQPTHLSGNLSAAVRIGRALLGRAPDETLLVTDEMVSDGALGEGVTALRVGSPGSNAALVGVDAQGPLCEPSEARLIATVQQFSPRSVRAEVAVRQNGRELVRASMELPPMARLAVPLTLPATIEGWVEVVLEAPEDGLRADNHEWVQLRRAAVLPVVVRSERPGFIKTVSAWLDACEALRWTLDAPASAGPFVMVTDRDQEPSGTAAGLVRFTALAPRDPTLSHWVAAPDHPVSAYLPPVQVVAAVVPETGPDFPSGMPAVWRLEGGRRLPVVVAEQSDGRRAVSLAFDPVFSGASPPELLVFLNSLRWVMGGGDGALVGAPITVGGFTPGPVRVTRPEGPADVVEVSGGMLRYDGVTLAGLYRFLQEGTEVVVGVNMADPSESNLLERGSTWAPLPAAPAGLSTPRRVPQPLTHLLLTVLLLMLAAEWMFYCLKRRALPVIKK